MLQESDLDQFTGTDKWYRLHGNFVFTDGIHFLAENAGAYWLLDAIWSWQPEIAKKKDEDLKYFQCWELKLNGKGGATLTCKADSNTPVVAKQEIEYTDFPFNIKLWVEGNDENLVVLLLPSEH